MKNLGLKGRKPARQFRREKRISLNSGLSFLLIGRARENERPHRQRLPGVKGVSGGRTDDDRAPRQ
jgi:hypothetical protein